MLCFIPVIAIIIGLFATSILSTKANYGNDFQTASDVLIKYNGTSDMVVVPDGIRAIGQGAFENNPLVKEVVLPSSVESINSSAFSGCLALVTISVPDSVSEIQDSAFYGCKNLENVYIGSGLRKLGNGVFSGCQKLDLVSIDEDNEYFICSDGVIYSSDNKVLYQYLPGKDSQFFVIPDVVEEVKRYAFWGADLIKDLTVSAGMPVVNEYAFSNMTSLENVTIQEPTGAIEIGAFDNDVNLHQIVLPVSMLNIKPTAFTNCPTDMTFVCDGNSKAHNFAQENGINTTSEPVYKVVFTEVSNDISSGNVSDNSSESSNEKDGAGSDERYLPNVSVNDDGTVLSETPIVSDRAFIVLGDGMTVHEISSDTQTANYSNEVSDYALYCSELTSYNIRETYPIAQSIGKLAFARSSLEEINIPEGITSIGYGAFYHCNNLSQVYFPNSITFVGGLAFEYTPWFEEWKDSSSDDYLIIGDGVLVSYKGDEEVIVLPSNIKHISQYAFKDHIELISITLNDGLESIEAESFYGCENLANIIGLSDNINVDSEAFSGCKYNE